MKINLTASWSDEDAPQVARIEFTKAQFMSLPAGIREMMLRLGWLTNDLFLFQRLWLATMNFEAQSVAGKDSGGSHAITLTLALLAKVFEGTQILGKWFFGAKEHCDVLSSFDAKHLEAVEEIKLILSETSRPKRIRDQFASHYSIKEPISPMMKSMDNSAVLSLYLGSPDGNSLRAYAMQAMVGEIAEIMRPEQEPTSDANGTDVNEADEPLMDVMASFVKHMDTLVNGIELYALSLMFPDGFTAQRLNIPKYDYQRGIDIRFPPLVARPIR